jgi:hypothetical protein
MHAVVPRLDTLMMVMKDYKENHCSRPWDVLYPYSMVSSLVEALMPTYHEFYVNVQTKLHFIFCESGMA